MAKTVQEIMQLIREQNIQMVDFKMVDIHGQFRHVTIPAYSFTEEIMTTGIGFDASNYGYAVVEKSDMVFIPDPDTAMIDPFCEIPTLSMTGNAMIIASPENRPLAQYPRNIIKAAVRAAGGKVQSFYTAYDKLQKEYADYLAKLPDVDAFIFDTFSNPKAEEIYESTLQAYAGTWQDRIEQFLIQQGQ